MSLRLKRIATEQGCSLRLKAKNHEPHKQNSKVSSIRFIHDNNNLITQFEACDTAIQTC